MPLFDLDQAFWWVFDSPSLYALHGWNSRKSLPSCYPFSKNHLALINLIDKSLLRQVSPERYDLHFTRCCVTLLKKSWPRFRLSRPRP